MARVTDKGLVGAIGNIIIYNSNGVTYARTKPGKRQKKGKKQRNPLNTVFGIVSACGTPMIGLLAKSFLFKLSLKTYNDARGWMRNQYAAFNEEARWELATARVDMCQLNTSGIHLRDFLGVDIKVADKGSGRITVTIPAIEPLKDIKAPAGAKYVNIKLLALTSEFTRANLAVMDCKQEYGFSYNSQLVPATEIVLSTRASENDIAIVVMALEFASVSGDKKIYYTDARWLPAAIVAMGRLQA